MARTVEIAAGYTRVQLPNGFAYDAGQQVVLTEEQYAKLSASALGTSVLDRGGEDLEMATATVNGAAPAAASNGVRVNIGGTNYDIPLTPA